MTSSERELLDEKQLPPEPGTDRFTSLQPTYEDSVPPEDDWHADDDHRS